MAYVVVRQLGVGGHKRGTRYDDNGALRVDVFALL